MPAQYIIRWCDVKPIVKSEDMEWKKKARDRQTDGRTNKLDGIACAPQRNRRRRETVRVSASAVQVGGHIGRVSGENRDGEEMVLRHKVIARHESFSRRLGISTHRHTRPRL